MIRRVLSLYLKSWLLLLWSAFCILLGVGWTLIVVVSVFKARGLM